MSVTTASFSQVSNSILWSYSQVQRQPLNNPPVLPAKRNHYAVQQQLMWFLASRGVSPSSTAKPSFSHVKLKPSAKPDSQLMIMAGIERLKN